MGRDGRGRDDVASLLLLLLLLLTVLVIERCLLLEMVHARSLVAIVGRDRGRADGVGDAVVGASRDLANMDGGTLTADVWGT